MSALQNLETLMKTRLDNGVTGRGEGRDETRAFDGEVITPLKPSKTEVSKITSRFELLRSTALETMTDANNDEPPMVAPMNRVGREEKQKRNKQKKKEWSILFCGFRLITG